MWPTSCMDNGFLEECVMASGNGRRRQTRPCNRRPCPQPPRPLDRLSSVHLMGVWGLRERAFSFISVELEEPRGPPSTEPCLAFFSSSLAIQSSSHSHFDMPWATATRYSGPLAAAAVVVVVSSSTRLFFFFMPYMHARTNPWIQSVYFALM